MGIVIFLVIAALMVAGGFLAAFFWASGDGQFDDTVTPAIRILGDDGVTDKPTVSKKKKESI